MTVSEHFQCMLCGEAQHRTLLDCGRHTGNDDSSGFGLQECSRCGFTRINPLPDEEQLRTYYHACYWSGEDGDDSKLMKILFKWRHRGVVSELHRYLPQSARILDWGAGDGTWVRLLRQQGFEAYGFDPYSLGKNSEFIVKGDINSLDFIENFFDAITCFHVLEHLPDPIGSLKVAMGLLKPGGIFIVEVPNIASWGFSIFKRRWQPLQLPTHFNHFTPKTLRWILEKNGAETLRVSHYSSRASKAAFVLSLFPGMTPKYVRQKKQGRYPLPLKMLYLLMQIGSYCYVLSSLLAKKGCIIRGYFRKKCDAGNLE